MIIIRPMDAELDINTRESMKEIQDLAQRIVCYYEDMGFADANLMRLPTSLLPKSASDLNNLFHDKMVRIILHMYLEITNC